MGVKMLAAVFLTVFLAELGDKTQVATLLLACNRDISKVALFVAASSALVLSSLIAVLLGYQLSCWVPPRIIKTIGGIGFIVIGIWVLWGSLLKS